ncbi:hypothetical protein DMP23_46735 [Amycolatopsis sp. A1MSW2902]
MFDPGISAVERRSAPTVLSESPARSATTWSDQPGNSRTIRTAAARLLSSDSGRPCAMFDRTA